MSERKVKIDLKSRLGRGKPQESDQSKVSSTAAPLLGAALPPGHIASLGDRMTQKGPAGGPAQAAENKRIAALQKQLRNFKIATGGLALLAVVGTGVAFASLRHSDKQSIPAASASLANPIISPIHTEKDKYSVLMVPKSETAQLICGHSAVIGFNLERDPLRKPPVKPTYESDEVVVYSVLTRTAEECAVQMRLRRDLWLTGREPLPEGLEARKVDNVKEGAFNVSALSPASIPAAAMSSRISDAFSRIYTAEANFNDERMAASRNSRSALTNEARAAIIGAAHVERLVAVVPSQCGASIYCGAYGPTILVEADVVMKGTVKPLPESRPLIQASMIVATNHNCEVKMRCDKNDLPTGESAWHLNGGGVLEQGGVLPGETGVPVRVFMPSSIHTDYMVARMVRMGHSNW